MQPSAMRPSAAGGQREPSRAPRTRVAASPTVTAIASSTMVVSGGRRTNSWTSPATIEIQAASATTTSGTGTSSSGSPSRPSPARATWLTTDRSRPRLPPLAPTLLPRAPSRLAPAAAGDPSRAAAPPTSRVAVRHGPSNRAVRTRSPAARATRAWASPSPPQASRITGRPLRSSRRRWPTNGAGSRAVMTIDGRAGPGRPGDGAEQSLERHGRVDRQPGEQVEDALQLSGCLARGEERDPVFGSRPCRGSEAEGRPLVGERPSDRGRDDEQRLDRGIDKMSD